MLAPASDRLPEALSRTIASRRRLPAHYRAVRAATAAAVTLAAALAGQGPAVEPALAATAASDPLTISGSRQVRVATMTAPTGRPQRSVWIYRPAVPDSRSLPVVYWLHGVPDQPWAIFHAGLAQSLNRWFAAGHKPFVVVAPDGSGAFAGDTEWADAASGADREESFLLHTVIPSVEGTNHRDAAHRAIAGFSMGAYGAINIATRHHGVFGQVLGLSGYYHVDDPNGVFGGRQDLVDANSPDRHPARARGLRILLDEGRDDQPQVVQGEAARFASLLARVRVPVTLAIVPGRHDYAYVASRFPIVEQFLDAGWR